MRQVLQTVLEALKLSVDALNKQNFDTGICCCGDSVESHNAGSGHSPVDQGDYYVDGVVGCVNTAIAAVEAALAEQRLQATDKVESSPEVATLEPVAWWRNKGGGDSFTTKPVNIDDSWTPLYTAPPQRKPLSDDEIQSGQPYAETQRRWAFKKGVRFAEKKHGIGEQE